MDLMLPPPGTTAAPMAAGLKRNFMKFAIFFSVNHGCVTSVLGISLAILGDEGSYMSGALYLTYAATALVASGAIIAALGTRGALICGTAVYCVYIVSLPLALLAKTATTQTLVAISGGAIGGVAAGFLWAAQGAYFAASAKLYADAGGGDGSLTPEQASASFAASFGVIFLGLELLLKVLPLGLKAIELAAESGDQPIAPGPNQPLSPPPPSLPPSLPEAAPASLKTSQLIVAVTYSILAIGSAIAMVSIWDLDKLKRERIPQSSSTECAPTATPTEESSAPPQVILNTPPPSAAPAAVREACDKGLKKAASAVILWRKKPTVVLLAPVQITFGLCVALLGYEMTGIVAPLAFPDNTVVAVGLLTALISLTSALLQVPFLYISKSSFGKAPVMIIGLLAFAALATLILRLSKEELTHYFPLILSYVLQGVGRACYEGTNKALYADFFPQDSEAAFANIVLAGGTASAVAFFVFPIPELTRMWRASAALVSALIALGAYVGAEAMHRAEKRRMIQ